ncbi:MAG: germination protein YpeB [Clostridia bacterium]
MEKFLTNLRNKFNNKYLGVMFFVVFSLTLLFGFDSFNNFKRQKQTVEDEYNRCMYELISYIKNVDLQLSKLSITTTDSLITTSLADIWRQSNLAKENLSNLPILQDKMGNTSKYLSQLSDFSYYLMKQTSRKEKITEEEYNNLKKMNESSSKLLEICNNIFNDLSSGSLKWNEVKNLSNERFENDILNSNVSNISKTFQDYEGLIYDGAFSDHIIDITPKMFTNNLIDENKRKRDYKKYI